MLSVPPGRSSLCRDQSEAGGPLTLVSALLQWNLDEQQVPGSNRGRTCDFILHPVMSWIQRPGPSGLCLSVWGVGVGGGSVEDWETGRLLPNDLHTP